MHKGGNKRKDDPDNSRAITLSCVFLKGFESVLLERSEDDINSILCIQQGGFQRGLSCMMTSFILRESIFYAREYHSKLYVTFLDGRKAFDTVWHDGLFHKLLFETNIDPTTFLAFRSLYSNMTSCVRYQGIYSDWFQVLRGT